MLQARDSILGRLGKALHIQNDDNTHEPLPKRWIDLILHLEEQERRRSEILKPEAESRRYPPKPN
jgi:hypothetical protein